MENPSSSSSFFGALKYFIFLILILLGIYYIFLFFFIIEPSSQPQNVFISNITNGQATISYTTKTPTKGTVLISKDGKFPALPLFVNPTKDDGEKNLKKSGFYTTHHITLTNLESKTIYKFRIYQRLRKVYDGQFKTNTVSSSLSSPEPVYGKVLTVDKKPIIGAIVYLQVENEASKSALLSTLTNNEGGWSIDLANLSLDDYTKEMVVVEAAELGRGKAYTTPGKDRPWPDILITKQ